MSLNPVLDEDAIIEVSSPFSANFYDLLEYVWTEKSPLKKSWVPSLVLSITALASAWLYVKPSLKFGDEQGSEAEAILQLMGNTSLAALTVYNIGGHYIDLIAATRDAFKFLKKNNLLNPTEHAAKCSKTVMNWLRKTQLHILILAALTATPLAAAAWFYKDYENESDVLLVFKTLVTFAVYTLIHTLPISLILEVPWLNFLLVKIPIAPFSLIHYLYRKCTLSKAELRMAKEVQRELSKQKALRSKIATTINGMVDRIQNNGFERKGCCYGSKLHDKTELFNLLNRIKQKQKQQQAIKCLLPEIDGFYTSSTRSDNSTDGSPSKFWQCVSYINSGVTKIFGIGGSLLVGTSIAGYLKVNYDLFYKLLKNSTVITLTLMFPPVAVSEVLTMYFGWLAFEGAYNYISKWITGHPKVPYAFKLNPLLSGFFLGVTYFLDAFSYGVALQLVRDSFDRKLYGEVLCDILEVAATYGIIAYGVINLAQLLEKLVEPLAKRWGSSEKRELVGMLNNLKRLAALIDRLDPKILQNLLNTIDDDRILKIFNLSKQSEEEIVNAQIQTHTKQQVSKSFWGNCCSFFFSCCKRENDEETTPLLEGGTNGL